MIKFISYSVVFVVLLSLLSCGTYNKVLNKGTSKERYKLANKMYKESVYNKAIRLYELAMPAYATKREAEVINFRLADASFFEEDYTTAVYYYEKFIRNYPKSTEIENGQYRIAESYYNLSPKYSVEQSSTKQAIEAFQNFIDQNPNSTKIPEANKRIDALNLKLEKKAFEIAKQYFKIGNYKSAIVAFDNVILDFLGTSYKEESMFFKFKSAYKLGVNSIVRKKELRIKEAIKVFNRYKKAFPSSQYLKEAEGLYKRLLKEDITKQNS